MHTVREHKGSCDWADQWVEKSEVSNFLFDWRNAWLRAQSSNEPIQRRRIKSLGFNWPDRKRNWHSASESGYQLWHAILFREVHSQNRKDRKIGKKGSSHQLHHLRRRKHDVFDRKRVRKQNGSAALGSCSYLRVKTRLIICHFLI